MRFWRTTVEQVRELLELRGSTWGITSAVRLHGIFVSDSPAQTGFVDSTDANKGIRLPPVLASGLGSARPLGRMANGDPAGHNSCWPAEQPP